ncbi:MAG: PHP domain-containing protein [Phycisphaerales bacterium]
MLTIVVAVLLALASPPAEPTLDGQDARPRRWLRGNTHTHTLWSDGDAPPETVIAWYVDHGYEFLVLSDHNLLQTGERWFDVTDDGRLTPAKVEAVAARFGETFPEIREQDGRTQMRLRRLDELRAMFDRRDGFVLVPGEEVTGGFRLAEIHVNALNVDEAIDPIRAESVQATIQANLDAIAAWGREKGRPVLAHLNHPNFRKSLGYRQLAEMRGERFFEVYNGHRSVENERIGDRPSTEEMWDLALVARLHGGAGDGELLYGLATDDAHDHYETDAVSVPGRGWVMVRCEAVDADEIVRALRRGDFYASSGVGLDDVRLEDGRLVVDLATDEGVTYRTEFIGALSPEDGAHPETPVARVLSATSDDPAVYTFTGNELYVRARVTSSRPHPRPYAKGDLEMAWTQPVRPPRTGDDETPRSDTPPTIDPEPSESDR